MTLTTFEFVTALSDGDEPNPWPAGIADTTWWFAQRCVQIGGQNAGIYADKPGFHNTVAHNQAKWPTNYSVNPGIAVLLAGPHERARAFDWSFIEAQSSPPDYSRINRYSARLLAASLAHDPRLRGLYEWFGTKDGANIGYNIYKDRPSSSDDSHDWHIHFSFITAHLLNWAVVHGVLSVLIGETLEAYLARGGQLIEGTTMTTFTDNDGAFFIWRMEALFNLRKTVQGGPEKGKEVPFVLALEKLGLDVDAIRGAVEAPSEPVTLELTDAQAALIGSAAGRKVLEVTASAEETAARVLREGAGGQ